MELKPEFDVTDTMGAKGARKVVERDKPPRPRLKLRLRQGALGYWRVPEPV